MIQQVVTTSTDGTVLGAATPNKFWRVMRYHLMQVGAGTVNVQFLSNTTPISGLKVLTAPGTGVACGNTQEGLFETAVGEALKIGLSGAIQVSLDYVAILVNPAG